jgi:signal transduction histidine kinase/HAMP domain-containing protein/ActR/RegA family two-component response regulator
LNIDSPSQDQPQPIVPTSRPDHPEPYSLYLEEQLRLLGAALDSAQSGQFSTRLEPCSDPLAGPIGHSFNAFMASCAYMVEEVNRVTREVAGDASLGLRSSPIKLSGAWSACTQSLNNLIDEVSWTTHEVAHVVEKVVEGDLSHKIKMKYDGRTLRGNAFAIGISVNRLVDRLRLVASEVTRVSREVGTEGKLGGQAEVAGVSGIWKDLTDHVNLLAGNLTDQVRNIALVTTAVANGDLSQTITVEAKGEIQELKSTVNTMVEQLRIFAAEVTRVAKEVGSEGKLGGQAKVLGIAGTWKNLTDHVNMLAGNLTDQVRNVALVTTAVANGDLSQTITVDACGEILELKNTINTMVEQLRAFAAEVTRVAREVGTEGRLGGQAEVRGVSGTWKDLTEGVNFMANNLTNQVRDIALVTTAVANGDLSQKITVAVRGEVLELKNTINTMVEQLRSFAAEVTRVAKEVGSEGKLGGQADVQGVSGTWKDLTNNVNLMASNLTNQVRGIVKVVTAVAEGDLSQKLVVEAKGEIAALADTINNMTGTLRLFADQVTTVAREVGIEGQLGGQARVPGASGTWRDLTDNVNMLASNLTSQVRNIAKVTTAVANGDLSQQITVDARGEILALKDTINSMVFKLRTFAAEVVRVAREVGTEGKLGGQAEVPGVAGTWKDLTENVNLMASNLTEQVRNIVKVVTAVATGDLHKKFMVQAKGEIGALADTINGMTDTLRTFAEQVTSVAREVGIEGRLGGQAKVPGAAGTWRDLTDNVNQLAGNLTTQVRAIAEVATAVTKGDLTRSIDVEAKGEVLSLKDTINQMINNLKDTTHANHEQDWLKTNLAKFSQMMQGQRSWEELAHLIMSELTPLVSAQHGSFYMLEPPTATRKSHLRFLNGYAVSAEDARNEVYVVGEGLIGQCAYDKKMICAQNVPSSYIKIRSSLGESSPLCLLILPILFEGELKGVIELASTQNFSQVHLVFLQHLMLSIGVVFNMITASMRTEELLKELKGSNVELEKRTAELEEKASLLELKNHEIAQASASLEDKATQLTRVSKYKSEFLTNMSHELRTPLNSLLILARLLEENQDNNLTKKQVEYAHTIYTSGQDLLALISQILDLSKIEAGKLQIETTRVPLQDLCEYIRDSFVQIAKNNHINFSVRLDPLVPLTLTTDSQRLQQILKNLLSNAFKFTKKGSIVLDVHLMEDEAERQSLRSNVLKAAPAIVTFAVRDTGIGIIDSKQELIFEAFQQADSSTSRMYGGTGLGLTISRELVSVLNGEIQVSSKPAEGSTFNVYLPVPPEDMAEKPNTSRLELSAAPELSDLAGWSGSDGAILKNKRVLLVDDDVRNLFAVTSLLERYGMRVEAVTAAQEALVAVKDHAPFDVVLMDIMLPGMDGYQATAAMRSMPASANIPIIALTAKTMPGDQQRCMQAGCNAFVPKPVDCARLLGTLKAAMTET